jgi:hypothetical protein
MRLWNMNLNKKVVALGSVPCYPVIYIYVSLAVTIFLGVSAVTLSKANSPGSAI